MPVASYVSLPVSFSISASYNTDLERRQTESSGHGYNTNSSQFTLSSASNSFPSASLFFTIGNTGIFLEGAAYIDEQLIKLTRSARQNKNVGRATYYQPFLLWETSTGKIADFTTHFTFMIDSGHADGMVFFIAPSGSLLNISAGGGGHLGLPVEELPGDTTRTLYPFVAVEFDIYRNEQPVIRDPVGDHVGIDINSLKSNITTPWNGDINEEKRNDAWISYNSSSKNLSVAFTSFQNGTNGTEVEVIKYLSYIIDLKQYLPDWVIVGFSAATGQDIAVHKIISWNFTSTALVDDDPTHNKPESIAPSGVKPGPGKSKMGLLLGLGIAGPSIQQAIQVLNFEVPLPILPSKMPAATYIAPPTLFSTLVSDSDTITSERGQTESSGTPHSLTITPSSTTKFVTPSTTFQSAQ
ncbi:hypothetical protein TB2_030382 [Malus domestica]